jgi:hypothetical protein
VLKNNTSTGIFRMSTKACCSARAARCERLIERRPRPNPVLFQQCIEGERQCGHHAGMLGHAWFVSCGMVRRIAQVYVNGCQRTASTRADPQTSLVGETDQIIRDTTQVGTILVPLEDETIVPHLGVGQGELVSRDNEAAIRPDQNGCKGGILPVFNPPLRIRLQ